MKRSGIARRRIVATLACGFLKCPRPARGSGNGAPREIWVDHDGGWEDIAALAVLLRSPDVRVLGVSLTPGIANVDTARQRFSQFTTDLYLRDLKLNDSVPAKCDLLVTGPLTRAARLIRQSKAPRSITWMGGALRENGNTRGKAEWNAAADPSALAQVLSSGVPFCICPLDLTNQFPSRLVESFGAASASAKAIQRAYEEQERYLWDELAAASIVAPGLFRSRRASLHSDRAGRLIEQANSQPNATILTACDTSGFLSLLRASLRY